VTHLTNAGGIVTVIPVGNHPTGVAVDAAGKVWVTNYNSHTAMRINPATNAVDLTVSLGSGAYPYNYSDMTGSTLIAPPDTGTWTIVHDSGIDGAIWGKVTWNTLVPGDGSLTVTAASSTDGVTFGPAQAVTHGVDLTVADGRYLQVSVTFNRATTGESPILYDLTILANRPPVADADGPYSTDEGSPVTLDGSGSFDPDGDPLTYAWDLDNDGQYDDANTVDPTVTFGDNGTFPVGLEVTDSFGESDTDSAVVTVNNVDPTLTLDTSSAVSTAGGDAFLGRQGIEQIHRASATDPGSDDLTFTWNFGSSATYYNDGTGPDPYPSPGGTFPFATSDSAGVTYVAPGLKTVMVGVADDDGGTNSASCAKLVTGDGDCTRTQGFWKHQFKLKGKHHIDDPTLQAYLDIIGFGSAVFSEQVPASTLEEAREVWERDASMRDLSQSQLLAAWLNFAHGAVGWDELIDTDGDEAADTPFYQVVSAAETILLNDEATHLELEQAKDLAEAVNLHDEDNPLCAD
jgi:hypothetical protein